MGRRVIRAGESNYFRGYKKLEVFAKLATTYLLSRVDEAQHL
jgi:hypothetical protein